MIPTERFERRLPELLTELAEPRTPDYFDDLLWQTAHTSQRSAWTMIERWISVDLTMSRVHEPRGARWIALFGILLLTVALALAIVGSQRRVPAPFGPAANGVIVFTTAAGDIAIGDPVTGTSRTIVDGPGRDNYPVFSRDGTRIAFGREVDFDGKLQVFVVDATGGTPVELTSAPLPIPGTFEWSPDDTLVAWLSEGSLWIAQTDGTDTHMVDLDMTVDEIEWRPADGTELLVHGARAGKTGLFLMNADGTDLRPATPLDDEGASDLNWSPDGRRFAYGNYPAWQVHVVTLDELRDTVVEPDEDLGLLLPRWSPDGARLAYLVRQSDASTRIGVAPVVDESPHVTVTGPSFFGFVDHDWSPDGSAILAVQWGHGAPWLIDPAGGPGIRTNWSSDNPPAWQRLAP
jgi:Tol biopolymer transport system component